MKFCGGRILRTVVRKTGTGRPDRLTNGWMAACIVWVWILVWTLDHETGKALSPLINNHGLQKLYGAPSVSVTEFLY